MNGAGKRIMALLLVILLTMAAFAEEDYVMPVALDERAVNYPIKVGAICYHQLCTRDEVPAGKKIDKYSIYVEEFEEHIIWLKEQGIRVISVGELADFVDGKIDLPEKCLLLTEDDCSISLYRHMLPLLVKYGVRINAAIIGDRADKASRDEAWHELYCSWEEIRAMAETGAIEFGSHTYGLHSNKGKRTGALKLKGEKNGNYRKVIFNSEDKMVEKILKNCGYTPGFFVYPFYAVSRDSFPVLLDEIGYRFLFCGDSDSSVRYLGDAIYPENHAVFRKGVQPELPIIKRFTPRSGDDFPALIERILE